MTLNIDEADPCAAAKALRAVYTNLIAGQSAVSVSFTSGPSGVSRSATFHPAHPARLLELIRSFEQKCQLASGKRPNRFALRGGGST